MKRWEYCEVNVTDNLDRVDKLGRDGWELVAVVAEPASKRFQAAIVAYLKRELPDV